MATALNVTSADWIISQRKRQSVSHESRAGSQNLETFIIIVVTVKAPKKSSERLGENMKYQIIFCAIALFCCSSAEVIQLEDADFQSKLSTYETSLVMFYAPW